MQGNVVKHRPDIVPLERFEYLLTFNFWCQQDVIHVRVLMALVRNDWPTQDALGFKWLKNLVIALPACQPFVSYSICFFKLSPQECRN